MRAIFINAEKKQITEIKLDPSDTLSGMQKCVGGLIESACEDGETHDTLFVNEEGLINGTQFGFTFMNKPFHGNGVICGHDPETGETVAAKTGLINVAGIVSFGEFREREEVYDMILSKILGMSECKEDE